LLPLADAPPATDRVIEAFLAQPLTEIERREPGDFRDGATARAYALDAGRRPRVWKTYTGRGGEEARRDCGYDWEPDEARRVEEARRAYLTYVEALTVEAAAAVPPLGHRLVLSQSARLRTGTRLRERRAVDPRRRCWYPLRAEPTPSDALALQQDWFYAEMGVEALREALRRHGVARVWELNESRLDPEYEMDTSLCGFEGIETYWSSHELDWLVYVSHESSITFAGAWLVEEIKRRWPGWERRLYTTYAYD
jgi:hypothetical protein